MHWTAKKTVFNNAIRDDQSGFFAKFEVVVDAEDWRNLLDGDCKAEIKANYLAEIVFVLSALQYMLTAFVVFLLVELDWMSVLKAQHVSPEVDGVKRVEGKDWSEYNLIEEICENFQLNLMIRLSKQKCHF